MPDTTGAQDPRKDTPRSSGPSRSARVLFVCSANRIRSPFAEAAARRLAQAGELPVEFDSAGTEVDTLGTEDQPALDQILRVASRQELDLSGHRAKPMTATAVSSADLVVTMTGAQVTQVVALAPDARSFTLTLHEAARAATDLRPSWDPNQLRRWTASVADRPVAELLGGSLDVADPIGGPPRGYRRAAKEINALLEAVLGQPGPAAQ